MTVEVPAGMIPVPGIVGEMVVLGLETLPVQKVVVPMAALVRASVLSPPVW